MDGISPNTIPTTIENTTDTTIDAEDIATGTSATFAITCESPIPVSTPIIPPMLEDSLAEAEQLAKDFVECEGKEYLKIVK